MKPENLSYEEFPTTKLAPKGMKTIKADHRLIFAKTQLQVKYAEKDGMPLHLQIIYPPMDRDTFQKKEVQYPLVVYIKGSGWRKQKLGDHIHGLCEFAVRGYVIAVVEYRPSDVAAFPAQIKDAKTAIHFLQKNADDYHIDKNNIFVWGESSGGHTSVMINTTMNREYTDEDGILDIRAFVDWYGPTDIREESKQLSIIEHNSPESPEGMLIGGRYVDENPELTELANPMTHICEKHKMMPLLILHGDKDRLVPFHQSVLLYEKMKELNKEVEFYKLEGADHADDAFFKKPVYDLIEQFMKKYMNEDLKLEH